MLTTAPASASGLAFVGLLMLALAGCGGSPSSATVAPALPDSTRSALPGQSEPGQSEPSRAIPSQAGPGQTVPTGISSPAGQAATKPKAKPALLYVFPVRSTSVSFGRAHHDYPATDIFAPCGSYAVAPVSGRVLEVSRTDTWKVTTNLGAARGGLSVAILGIDGARYYGSHLRSIASGMVPGHQVKAGDLLGEVGNTGDARGIACHLHFGISPPCGSSDWWIRRGVLSPYPFLKSWQAGRDLSPRAAVLTWRADHGCPKTPLTDP